jgi:hypothetical protein
MERVGRGQLHPPNWVSCLTESRSKMQGLWSLELKRLNRQALLQELSLDEKVDFRSFGGQGAGGFLEPPVVREGETPAVMPNAHFHIGLCDRLLLPLCPPGSTCQHRSKQGVVCGKDLDRRGKHAKLCEFGSGRHDSLRDFSAGYHQRTTGLVAHKEQRVVAWDRTNPATGEWEEARLDFATRDAITGQSIPRLPAPTAATSCVSGPVAAKMGWLQ